MTIAEKIEKSRIKTIFTKRFYDFYYVTKDLTKGIRSMDRPWKHGNGNRFHQFINRSSGRNWSSRFNRKWWRTRSNRSSRITRATGFSSFNGPARSNRSSRLNRTTRPSRKWWSTRPSRYSRSNRRNRSNGCTRTRRSNNSWYRYKCNRCRNRVRSLCNQYN